jgi:hypothetical protein
MATKRKNKAISANHPSKRAATGGKVPRKDLGAKAARKAPASTQPKKARRYRPGSMLSHLLITGIF